jgi:hypothetical protein
MEPKVSPMNVAVKWGLVLGALSIITTTINYLTGTYNPENPNMMMTWLMFFVTLIVVILVLIKAMQDHRDKDLGGYMTYGRGLGVGTLTGVFYGIVSAICVYVVFKFLLPADYVDRVLEATRNKILERNPNATDDQIEVGLKFTKMGLDPVMGSIFRMLGNVLFCFLLSLIISAFMRKRNPEEMF